MRVVKSVQEMRSMRSTLGQKVGFVPTMGALHSGHESLLKLARAENEQVVLSIFVNPTQFNNPDDLKKYPQTWDADLEMAKRAGVDIVFSPEYTELYPDSYRYQVTEKEFSRALCGAHRPGHFDGVLSVVMKFFNIVKPMKAYFGEKDFQQLTLIEDMVKSFFMDIKIVHVPTVREDDGLAKSSRNVRLSLEERKVAPQIYKIITTSGSATEAKEKLSAAGFDVDYVEDKSGRRYVAATLGAVRLIDNVTI